MSSMKTEPPSETRADSAIVPEGFTLRPLATGLTFPTAIAFSDDRIWVSESGATPMAQPRIVEIGRDGQVTPILSDDQLPEGALAGPVTDITFHEGEIWLTHRQMGVNDWMVGAVSKFKPDDPAGTFTTLVTNLPSAGDHFANEIAFDASGRVYFAHGTATNSSVVGPDNEIVTGWLSKFPDFRDFPAHDVVLNGKDFSTPVLTTFPASPDGQPVKLEVQTAPFMPFGSGPVEPGTVVQAATPQTPQDGIIAGVGAVYSFDPSADNPDSTLRLESWGLRNPFGIGFDPSDPGLLFATNNDADIRTKSGSDSRSPPAEGAADDLTVVGSRPIANDFDDLFTIRVGGKEEFFGWPDYFHDPRDGSVLPVTDPLFAHAARGPAIDAPSFVLDEAFRQGLDVQPAFAQFENHSSANKFDFSRGAGFGSVGDLFVAETGSFVPITGARQFAGYKVVQVDRQTGEVSDFIVNGGDTVEEVFDPSGFNKPIDVKFRGEDMLVVDFGVFEPGVGLMEPGTGKVWVVSRDTEGGPGGAEEIDWNALAARVLAYHAATGSWGLLSDWLSDVPPDVQNTVAQGASLLGAAGDWSF